MHSSQTQSRAPAQPSREQEARAAEYRESVLLHGAPEMQLQASAVVQPVGRKAFLLLAESYSENSVGAGAYIHPDQPGHFLLPALNADMLCSAAHA